MIFWSWLGFSRHFMQDFWFCMYIVYFVTNILKFFFLFSEPVKEVEKVEPSITPVKSSYVSNIFVNTFNQSKVIGIWIWIVIYRFRLIYETLLHQALPLLEVLQCDEKDLSMLPIFPPKYIFLPCQLRWAPTIPIKDKTNHLKGMRLASSSKLLCISFKKYLTLIFFQLQWARVRRS